MMKKSIIICLSLACVTTAWAGNKNRVGQAGGNQLQMHPWAKSAGMGMANTASVSGIESMHMNVAGMVGTKKTELAFTRLNLYNGAGINANSFGFSQRVGETAVIGVGVMSLNFGELEQTTEDLPEGGSGSIRPQFLNLGISFAKSFSPSISGGFTVKTLSEGVPNAIARGVAFDAGIRYVTGDKDNLKFGIALRNVGPKMQYNGDGFSQSITLDGKEFTLETRSSSFEIPALLNIGASYDIHLLSSLDSSGTSEKSDLIATIAGSFTSNSFGRDQIHAGAELGYKETFYVRAGYIYEEGITGETTRFNIYTGPTLGASVALPLNQDGSRLALDYSYRFSNPFKGTHGIGLRILL